MEKTLTSISGQTELRRMILAEFRDPTLRALKSLAMGGGGAAVTSNKSDCADCRHEADMVTIKFFK